MIITPQSVTESAETRILERAKYYDTVMTHFMDGGWSVVENEYDGDIDNMFFKRSVTMKYAEIYISTQIIRRYIDLSNGDDPSNIAEAAFAVDGMAVSSSLCSIVEQMLKLEVTDTEGIIDDADHFTWFTNIVTGELTASELRTMLDDRFSAMFDKPPDFNANLGVYKNDISGVWGYGDPESHTGWTSAKASIGATFKKKIKRKDDTLDSIKRIMLLPLSSMRGLVAIGEPVIADL